MTKKLSSILAYHIRFLTTQKSLRLETVMLSRTPVVGRTRSSQHLRKMATRGTKVGKRRLTSDPYTKLTS